MSGLVSRFRRKGLKDLYLVLSQSQVNEGDMRKSCQSYLSHIKKSYPVGYTVSQNKRVGGFRKQSWGNFLLSLFFKSTGLSQNSTFSASALSYACAVCSLGTKKAVMA